MEHVQDFMSRGFMTVAELVTYRRAEELTSLVPARG
jgi:hypothetical protein